MLSNDVHISMTKIHAQIVGDLVFLLSEPLFSVQAGVTNEVWNKVVTRFGLNDLRRVSTTALTAIGREISVNGIFVVMPNVVFSTFSEGDEDG